MGGEYLETKICMKACKQQTSRDLKKFRMSEVKKVEVRDKALE